MLKWIRLSSSLRDYAASDTESSVIPFLLSLSAYSDLTEIKTFTGINIVQSLHMCKRMLV